MAIERKEGWPRWEVPLANASGPHCTTYEELLAIAHSRAGGIVTKSMTHCPRRGNPSPRLHRAPWGSLNAMGLPNPGFRAYAEILPRLKRRTDKPVVASLAFAPCEHPLTPPESYLELAQAMEEAGADLLEINLSCPNVESLPLGLDPETVEEVLAPLAARVKIPFSVKLPPYNNDPRLFRAVAERIVSLEVAAVTTMNSEPACLEIDLEAMAKVLRPNDGFGGLGGPAVLSIALAEVHRFYRYFQEAGAPVAVIGVGGIQSWQDALKHFLAGACQVQVGTALLAEGPGVFARIWDGIRRWLEERDLRLEQVIGAVRDRDQDQAETEDPAGGAGTGVEGGHGHVG